MLKALKLAWRRNVTSLVTLSPPIVITNKDLNQHYLEETWKHTNIFDKLIMNKRRTGLDDKEKT